MNGVLRRTLFTVPFGCLIALLVHVVRFGDDHAFGGDGNEALVATAIGGSIAIALVIFHGFLTAGTTVPTGTIAAARARQLVPGVWTLFVCAAATYYGIESLEGNGIELGLPTVLLAIAAAFVAIGLRAIVALFAGLVAGMVRDWIALLDRRERVLFHRSLQVQPIHSQVTGATRRFGRAPPNERRFS